MNSDLEKLIDLQKVDAEIARLNAEVAALPKKVQAIEAQLADARSRVEKAKASIKTNEQVRRGLESDIQTQREKISKYRDQSSSVKTNDQYKALMQEIQFAETQIRSLEDKILDKMEEVEKLQADQKKAEADLKAETAEIEQEKEEARAVTARDQQELAELNGRRSELRSHIEESTLRHFDRVSRLRGTGIAEARDQRCMGCQVMLRPQVYNDVVTGNGVQVCDSCTRLLYHVPENNEVAEDKAKSVSASGESAWVYLEQLGENGAFAAFSNSRGSASMRTYDAATGKVLDKPMTHKGQSYKQAFSEYLSSGRHLWVDNQPNLEQDCKEELPAEILEELRRQIPDRTSKAESTQS